MGCLFSKYDGISFDTKSYTNGKLDIVAEEFSKEQLSQETRNIIKQIKKSKNYTSLVFEGGGVKGFSYCGVVNELERMGVLQRAKNFSGTSIGSLVAALLAIGYTAEELKKELISLDFKKMMDSDIGFIRGISRIFNKYGYYKGKALYKNIRHMIKNKTGDADYTFGQLFRDTGVQLVVVATNVNLRRSIYFSHQKYADLPIAIGVRASMSVPVMFQPVKINGNLYVDGGMMANYPIYIFDSENHDDYRSEFNLNYPNYKTLGFKITVNGERESYIRYECKKVNSFKSFLVGLWETYDLTGSDRSNTAPNWARTVYVETPDIPLTKVQLNKNEIDSLIQSGIDSVREYFSQE